MGSRAENHSDNACIFVDFETGLYFTECRALCLPALFCAKLEKKSTQPRDIALKNHKNPSFCFHLPTGLCKTVPRLFVRPSFVSRLLCLTPLVPPLPHALRHRSGRFSRWVHQLLPPKTTAMNSQTRNIEKNSLYIRYDRKILPTFAAENQRMKQHERESGDCREPRKGQND